MELSTEEENQILIARFTTECERLMAKIQDVKNMHEMADIYQKLTDYTRKMAGEYDILEERIKNDQIQK